jgi:hypothetical protein
VHGKFNQDLERSSEDKGKSMAWLCTCRSGLKGDMENLITAAQDQALNMRYYQRNIMQQPIGSKCRMCYKAEHSKHIVARCLTLAPSKYTSGHNKVAGCIH